MRTASRLLLAVILLAGCPPKQPTPTAPVPESGAAPEAPAPAPVTPAPDTRGMTLDQKVEQAAGLIEKGTPGDLERAIQILEPIATEDPSGVARFDLAVAYQKRGDLARASNQYQAVIAVQPDNGDAWLYLGKIQESQGSLDGAIGNFQSGIRNDPENIELRVALIAALRKKGRLDEAIEASKAALKVNANSLGVYNNFGLAYLDKGDTALARFIFQKALQQIEGADQNAYLQTNIGWSFYLEGNVPAATQSLQKAVELDPELVPALVYLSRVYMDDRNFGDTVPLLETAAKLDPNNADVQLTLGVAYRGIGRLEDARKAYERALTLDPSDPAPYMNIGILLGDYLKDYDGAVAQFSQYIAAGGKESAMADAYIKEIQKEKERAEKRLKAEAERKKRDEERKKKEELIKNAPAPAPAPDGAPEPAPDEPTPEPEPAPEPAPEGDPQ